MNKEQVQEWLARPAKMTREERLIRLVVDLSQKVDELQAALLERDLSELDEKKRHA